MALSDLGDFERPRRSRMGWTAAGVIAVVALGILFLIRNERSAVREVAPPASGAVDRPSAPAAGRSAPVAGTPSATVGVSSAVLDLMAQAAALERNGALGDAREKYMDALHAAGEIPVRGEIEGELGRLSMTLLFAPHPMREKTDYIVKDGDSVARIAGKFGTTPELVQKANNIRDASYIKAGDLMRVCTGTFAVAIGKSRNDVLLTLDGRFCKRYLCGTGKYAKTPVGTFTIADRITNPPWHKPGSAPIPFGDPENILGTRWMSLRAAGATPDIRGYGIHGTWETNSIGKAESMGCVRMVNRDVEELFDLLPLGTPVAIAE